MPFITIDSSQWQPFLADGFHDLYHLPEYCALDAGTIGGEALGWTVAINNRSHLIPLIRRPVSCDNIAGNESPLYDLISPYGYPGMLSKDKLTADEACHVFTLFHEEAAAAGYISSFIRLNPLLNNWLLPANDFMRQFRHGDTLSIDLKILPHDLSGGQSGICEQTLHSFSQNHRRNLDRLHREGYSVVVNTMEYLPQFAKAYTATMIRHQAHHRYYFSEDYFNRLFHLALNHICFLSVLSPDGEFNCGGLFSVFGPVMQYLFGATVESAQHQSPSKLMIEEAMNVGLYCGAEVLHLGGGAGASSKDGVYRFKLGFTHKHSPYHCLHFIHRPIVYQKLEDAARSYTYDATDENHVFSKVGEHALSSSDASRFFPSYRSQNE